MPYHTDTVGRSAARATAALLFIACCIFAPACEPASASGICDPQGRASWYGTTAHGKQTANGEIYNRYALTAAHKTLPFGTVVRVHNLQNDKHVLVRINDRGPFVKGRIVDVSFKAAQVLEMVTAGVVPVHLEIVAGKEGKPINGENAFYIHIANTRGAFEARDEAAALSRRLGMPVKILFRPEGPDKGFALCLGPFKQFKEAHRLFMTLKTGPSAGIDIIEAPVRGRVPFYIPGKTYRRYSDEQRQQLLEQYAVLWKTFTASSHPALYAVSLLAIKK